MGWQNSLFQLLIIEGSGPGSGLFVYSGAPGPSNPPVLSIVSPGVTADPFGNPVVSVLEVRGSAGVVTITDPAVIDFVSGAVTTGSIKSLTASQRLSVSGAQGLSLPCAGNNVIMDSLSFIACGSDGTGTVPAPWHSEIVTGTGWSGTFKWRRGAENEIKFQCGLVPGTDTDGTTICSLLGVSPAASQTHAVWANALRTGAVGAATEAAALQLDTSGNVKCLGIAAACTSLVGVGYWPLDN